MTKNVIMGPYQFQKRNKDDPNEEWIDIDFAKIHWALRSYYDDPLGTMERAINGEIVNTPYVEYRAVRRF